MTRKNRRIVLISAAFSVTAVAVALALFALRDTIVFFYTPSDLVAKQVAAGTTLRLGGLVEMGSVVRGAGNKLSFVVTDNAASIRVEYVGIVPDLFREGQGVVAMGSLTEDGVFVASQILAKHDENYMPREVAEALKKSGEWRGEDDGS